MWYYTSAKVRRATRNRFENSILYLRAFKVQPNTLRLINH
jgi:hypothetical protein